MNDNKKYIKLEYTDYGYEIYVIHEKEKIKLNKQDKIIMSKILKKFPYQKTKKGNLIYPNIKLIALYFNKEKLTFKGQKVNRGKSKKILPSVILTTSLILGAAGIYNQIKTSDEQSTAIVEAPIGHTTEIDEDYYEDILEEILPNLNEADSTNEATESITDINEFCYECENPGDKQALINASQYMEVFQKYERIYGVDANLLCAIGAQESSGIHYSESKNGGHATGIMGIENIWANGTIKVFNFDTNAYETITVDYSQIGNLDYNVKIGAAIFQNYFYDTIKNNTSIDASELLALTIQKYNMGPGNIRKILSLGDDWIANRIAVRAGDQNYFEHVLSRLDNNEVIRIRLENGDYHDTKITNITLESKHTRT